MNSMIDGHPVEEEIIDFKLKTNKKWKEEYERTNERPSKASLGEKWFATSTRLSSQDDETSES